MSDPALLTPEQIAALEALEKAATAGRWYTASSGIYSNDRSGELVGIAGSRGETQQRDDAAFIAALRNAAPDLIAAARREDERRYTDEDFRSQHSAHCETQAALAAAHTRIAELVADLATAEARISELVEGEKPRCAVCECFDCQSKTCRARAPVRLPRKFDPSATAESRTRDETITWGWPSVSADDWCVGDFRRAARLLTEGKNG